jgi:hypothetical protein
MVLDTLFIFFKKTGRKVTVTAIEGQLPMADVLMWHLDEQYQKYIVLDFYNGSQCTILHNLTEFKEKYINSRSNYDQGQIRLN